MLVMVCLAFELLRHFCKPFKYKCKIMKRADVNILPSLKLKTTIPFTIIMYCMNNTVKWRKIVPHTNRASRHICTSRKHLDRYNWIHNLNSLTLNFHTKLVSCLAFCAFQMHLYHCCALTLH